MFQGNNTNKPDATEHILKNWTHHSKTQFAGFSAPNKMACLHFIFVYTKWFFYWIANILILVVFPLLCIPFTCFLPKKVVFL